MFLSHIISHRSYLSKNVNKQPRYSRTESGGHIETGKRDRSTKSLAKSLKRVTEVLERYLNCGGLPIRKL